MKRTARFVIWISSKFIPLDSKHLTGFTREEIEEIIQGLLDVLANRNPLIKPKDDFKEKHPRHRSKARYFCYHCRHSVYLWKEPRSDVGNLKGYPQNGGIHNGISRAC